MRTLIFLSLLFFFFIETDPCLSQVYTRSWVSTYGNDSVPYDFAPNQMCISKSGNIYIVSNKDTVGSTNMIALTRYDSLGNIIWDRVYANPYNYDASIACMACDAEENIFLGGSEYVPNNANDYLVLKYDSAGNLKWKFNYNAVGNDYDYVNALELDSFGNTYITGVGALTGDPTYDTDALTCKIDSSGNLVWASYYNYPVTTTAYDNGLFLKLNAIGEIVVGGSLNGTYTICKYDTAGNRLWTGYPVSFQIGGMALDDSANCYVFSYGSGQNVPLAKYDSSGIIQWNKSTHFQNGGSLLDILIRDDFLYATGYAIIDTAHKTDVLLVKYNLNGDTLWTRYYNNSAANLSDVGFKILCDSSCNLIISGRTTVPGIDYDILVLKYDSSGNYEWEYQTGDTTINDYFSDAVLDSAGNIFICGNPVSYRYSFEAAKISSAGSLQWLDHRVNYQKGTDYGIKIIRDDAGDIITVGTSMGKTLGGDIVVIKYDPAGNQLWMTRFNVCPHNSMIVTDIMCDRSGNIFVCGAIDSTSSGTNFHALTAVFSPSGNLIWSSLYAPLFEAVSFAFDSSENLYVLGNIRLAAYRYDAALLKYDSNGNLLWEKPIADTTAPDGQRIIFDGTGSFFISLTQIDLIGNSADITLMKIDTAGNKIWRRNFNGPWSQADFCEEMVLDNNLNPILTGYSDSLDYDIVVVKYDSSGNYLWNYRYAGTGNNWDWPKDVTVDEQNNIYVTGKVNDSNYVEQCITLKFDPAGNLLWDALYEGNGSTQQHVGNVIAVSDSGRVLVLGVTRDSYIMILVYDASGNQIFLDTTLVSGYFYNDIRTDILTDENETFYITSCIYNWSNMTDVVTIKYADILLKTEENANSSNGLTAFPNPFSTTFTLSFFSDQDIAATVEIINSAGIKLSEEKIRLQKGKNQFQLDASLLSAGLYTIVLKKPDGEMASKRIISIK